MTSGGINGPGAVSGAGSSPAGYPIPRATTPNMLSNNPTAPPPSMNPMNGMNNMMNNMMNTMGGGGGGAMMNMGMNGMGPAMGKCMNMSVSWLMFHCPWKTILCACCQFNNDYINII